MALLKIRGNEPELRDELVSAVREGRSQSSKSNRSGVVWWSREQVLRTDSMVTCLTITSVTGSTVDSVTPEKESVCAGNAETV